MFLPFVFPVSSIIWLYNPLLNKWKLTCFLLIASVITHIIYCTLTFDHFSHIMYLGMPYPQNLETAREVEAIVRQNEAIPATIAILDGIPCIGVYSKLFPCSLGVAWSSKLFFSPFFSRTMGFFVIEILDAIRIKNEVSGSKHYFIVQKTWANA